MANEDKHDPILFVQLITKSQVQKYFEFQSVNLGKNITVQAAYFANLSELFSKICKYMKIFICRYLLPEQVLKLTNDDITFYTSQIAELEEWLLGQQKETHFRENVWNNIKKQEEFLSSFNLKVTKDDFAKVIHTTEQIIYLLNNLWHSMAKFPLQRDDLWKVRKYGIMESHAWLVWFHYYLFGIRNSSLLQIQRDNFILQYDDTNSQTFPFTYIVRFLGFDKSKHGGVDRKIGINRMVIELMYYLNERIPKIYQYLSLPISSTCIFFSYCGKPMKNSGITDIVKECYATVLDKYIFPRLARFWIGHYAYERYAQDEKMMDIICFLMNHSKDTHLKYYVCSDYSSQRNISEDTTLMYSIMDNEL